MRFGDAQGLAVGLVKAVAKAPRKLCLEVPRQEAPEAKAKLMAMLNEDDGHGDGLEFVVPLVW